MKNITIISLIILLLLCLPLVAEAQEFLNMHLSYHRFLDENGDTILLVDYQIPYRSLLFSSGNGAYFAQVEVELSFSYQDSTLFNRKVLDNIGITNKYDAQSAQKSYLNRFSVKLEEDEYFVRFKAYDINSEKEFNQSFFIESLAKDARLSDIELNSNVSADAEGYLKKFQRDNKVYEPAPSIILSKLYYEYAHLYFELYSKLENYGENLLLILDLERDNTLVLEEYLEIVPTKKRESFSLKLPLEELEPGKYHGKLSLLLDDIIEEKSFDFVLAGDSQQLLAIFTDVEDEHNLMRYFMGSKMPKNWQNMSEDTKRLQITRFWKEMAISTNMSEERIMDLVHERVEHANRFYSSQKSGWTSDMGRIYIRNGAPAEIEKGTSSDRSRFARKDYQIWKYSTGDRPVYLFIDIQMNNNYRLIYVSGDDMEISSPDWQRFLGSDFDTNLLNN